MIVVRLFSAFMFPHFSLKSIPSRISFALSLFVSQIPLLLPFPSLLFCYIIKVQFSGPDFGVVVVAAVVRRLPIVCARGVEVWRASRPKRRQTRRPAAGVRGGHNKRQLPLSRTNPLPPSLSSLSSGLMARPRTNLRRLRDFADFLSQRWRYFSCHSHQSFLKEKTVTPPIHNTDLG